MNLALATPCPPTLAPARNAIGHAGIALRAAFGGGPVGRSALAELGAAARIHRAAPKATLVRHEDPATSLWLLGEGWASVGRHDAAGHWWQTRPVRAGEWIDVASAWRGGQHLETANAETAVLAYELPLADVEAACHLHPELWRRLLDCMAARVDQLTEGARELVAKDVTARLAGWLLQALPGADATRGEITLRQHKRTLASQLGTSPETFSRALRQLHQRGFIEVDRYRIRVHDAQGLRQLLDGPALRKTAAFP